MRRSKHTHRSGDWLPVVLVSLCLVIGVRLVVQHYVIDQRSMEPTLPAGQYILVNRLAYLQFDPAYSGGLLQPRVASAATIPAEAHTMFEPFGRPLRGDIVVFEVAGGQTMIKRIIGLPGEMISIRNQSVYINEAILDEPYLTPGKYALYTLAQRSISQDEYFVLGDNRNASYDSHAFGTIPRRSIIGRALLRYWSLEQIAWLNRGNE